MVSGPRRRKKIVVRSLLFFAALLGVASGNSIAQEALNRLIFTGDVMLSRAVRRQILEARDPALPFRKMAPMLAASDIAFVNLESPFFGQGLYREGRSDLSCLARHNRGSEARGIAIASTANNHSRDCASHGWNSHCLASKHGVEPVGSGESVEAAHKGIVLVRHGVRFGFLGYTYDQKNGNWKDTDPRIARGGS